MLIKRIELLQTVTWPQHAELGKSNTQFQIRDLLLGGVLEGLCDTLNSGGHKTKVSHTGMDGLNSQALKP